MNPIHPVLVVSFLRQRLGSPLRLVLLGFMFFSPLMVVAVTKQVATLAGTPAMFALVLAAGAIGQEISSGVLTLTFARPVTRAAYVLSRWAGAAGFAAALGLTQVALGLMAIAARGGSVPAAGEVAGLVVECVLTAGAAAAVMVMFSSLMNGLGDVALWALASVTGGLAGMVGQAKNWPALVRAASEVDLTLMPKLQAGWLFGLGDPQVYALVAVLSTTTAALAVAVWVVNRKELSYAAG
jgi:ABC-type transport system involved in multi-copper enzyme maturation permease subunit